MVLYSTAGDNVDPGAESDPFPTLTPFTTLLISL